MTHHPTAVGFGQPEPVLPVRDLAAAMAFYARLGFGVRLHDAGYGYAEREDLRIHLRASPELAPFSSYTEVYVPTTEVDRLHEEWQTSGLLSVSEGIGPELEAEVRRRWHAGEPVGLMSLAVKDTSWRTREFSIRDLDNNQLRFGRSTRATSQQGPDGQLEGSGCQAGSVSS